MTAPRSVIPTDKEVFFREYLVPAGQLAEILIATLPVSQVTVGTVRLSRSRGGDALYRALHRASCYAINPATVDLVPLADALTPLMAAMRSALRSRSLANLSKALNSGTFLRLIDEKVLADFFGRLPRLVSSIDLAIGYPDKGRKDWLAAQLEGGTPLTRNWRTGTWRTLVRNTSWAACMSLLGMGPAQLRHTLFSSRPGVDRAPQLWRDTFPVQRTLCLALPAPVLSDDAVPEVPDVPAVPTVPEVPAVPTAAPGTAPVPETTMHRLPAGVTVSSGADGMLQVSARLDPRTMLTPAQQAALTQARAVRISPALAKALQERTCTQSTDLLQLAAAVQAAHQWLQEQLGTREQLTDLFDAWQHAVRVKTVQDKLNTHFNAEERVILAALLAADGRGQAAPVPAA
jgi:hypothetical protein